jgi:hypothetical protein
MIDRIVETRLRDVWVETWQEGRGEPRSAGLRITKRRLVKVPSAVPSDILITLTKRVSLSEILICKCTINGK